MKGARMPVVSLRRVNFRFWSHLGRSGQNTIIFSSKGLHSKGCTRRNMNKLYIFNPFYLLDSGNKSLNKGWATPRLVSFRGLIQNFRRASPPLSYPLILEVVILLKIKRRDYFSTRQHSYFRVTHCENSELQIAVFSK